VSSWVRSPSGTNLPENDSKNGDPCSAFGLESNLHPEAWLALYVSQWSSQLEESFLGCHGERGPLVPEVRATAAVALALLLLQCHPWLAAGGHE
jgi:hypothetical protein